MLARLVAVAVVACLAGGARAEQNPTKPYVPSVYDSTGKLVGPLIAPNIALFKLNGIYLGIPVSGKGFPRYSSGVSGLATFLFTTPDCTGEKYIVAGGLPHTAFTYKDRLFFANEPIQTIQYQSFRFAGPGECNTVSPAREADVGLANSRPLPQVGNYIPPFSLH